MENELRRSLDELVARYELEIEANLFACVELEDLKQEELFKHLVTRIKK